MASDSLFEEMEPRIHRPLMPYLADRGLDMPQQVTEPSLYAEDFLSPFKEVLKPRATIPQTSPVKSPGFIPQLTPLSVLKKSNSRPSREISSSPKTPTCACHSSPSNYPSNASPSVDPALRELIYDQNKQLSLLQKQVEQLLQYQEKLHDKIGEKERANGSTQTSFFDAQSPSYSPTPVRVFPVSNNASPPMRQPEITLTFRDLQLETIVEQPPSPQPSFVVNMQDYQESVSEQDESVSESCVNVMDHVQKLLAQVNVVENKKLLVDKPTEKPFIMNGIPENHSRRVTMQRVKELGISFINPFSNIGARNPKFHPRSASRPNHMWDTRKETDQSVEMQRLAEKYLGQPKTSDIRQPELTFRNTRSVEMSMSSQQYLERYGLQEDD